MTEQWIALVPLRAGSKGLPGKNTRPLAGKPLYRHAVDQGLEAGATQVFLSTDIPALLAADHGDGVHAVPRPAELAGDTVPMDAVLRHFLTVDFGQSATVVLLQATSPLRRAEHIRGALEVFARGSFDLVMSVTETAPTILKYGTAAPDGRFVPVSDPAYCFTNRQALPKVYRPNGAVYVFGADWYRQNGSLATQSIGMFEMDSDSSQDIDTEADFARAERLLDQAGRS